MAQRICSVEDCEKQAATAGMCNAHYLRLKRYGSTADRRPDLAIRFVRTGWTLTEDGCWLWAGLRNSTNGYGRIRGEDGYTVVYAHRVAYELFVGDLIEGQEILHSCDTPGCVSPFHLRQGSSRENAADMVDRHRTASYADTGASLCRAGLHDITKPGALKTISNGARKYGPITTQICVQCRRDSQGRWVKRQKESA